MIGKITKYIHPGIQNSLTKKIKLLQNMNQMLAHNLRGAAGNIKMLAEIIIAKKPVNGKTGEKPDDILTSSEAIKYIHESSNSILNTLSTAMKETERPANENITSVDCDIAAIVNDISCQLQVYIHHKKAVIELNLDTPYINYPKLYMESILYNFINNSLKYCGTDIAPRIVIATYTENGTHMLSVKDNGIGIDMEAYGSRIFKMNEVFHRGYESTGMGLSITRNQIESMGGSISVKSKVDEGSEFIVTF